MLSWLICNYNQSFSPPIQQLYYLANNASAPHSQPARDIIQRTYMRNVISKERHTHDLDLVHFNAFSHARKVSGADGINKESAQLYQARAQFDVYTREQRAMCGCKPCDAKILALTTVQARCTQHAGRISSCRCAPGHGVLQSDGRWLRERGTRVLLHVRFYFIMRFLRIAEEVFFLCEYFNV